MYNIEREPSEYLLACFFAECETQFRFLESKHGFHSFSGLVDYKNGRQIITPYNNQNIENGFQAMTRYEKDDDAFEIVFDDMYLLLEGYAYYNRINRFEFSEVLDSAKKTDNTLMEKRPAHHRDGVRNAIEQIAAPLKNNIKYFINPSEKQIERVLTMRGKRIEHKIRAHYETIIEETCAKAARAFLEKNYKSVIELLSPYEKDLSAADFKKLEKAKKSCKTPV